MKELTEDQEEMQWIQLVLDGIVNPNTASYYGEEHVGTFRKRLAFLEQGRKGEYEEDYLRDLAC